MNLYIGQKYNIRYYLNDRRVVTTNIVCVLREDQDTYYVSVGPIHETPILKNNVIEKLQ